MERARAIKSRDEVEVLRRSLQTCEQSVWQMRERLEPGMRESDALAMLIEGSVQRGGEYPETRLLSSGPRTNPWFQETSDRVIETGDLLSFDTDLIGPMGYYNDISRSWVVGDSAPSDEQRRLYALAYEQMQHNTALLQVGSAFSSTPTSLISCPITASPTATPMSLTVAGSASSTRWSGIAKTRSGAPTMANSRKTWWSASNATSANSAGMRVSSSNNRYGSAPTAPVVLSDYPVRTRLSLTSLVYPADQLAFSAPIHSVTGFTSGLDVLEMDR